jgi:amino acid adenylation domain-containing protein
MCVPELIQAQAKAKPRSVALVDGDQQLTYRELDDHSSELAALLRSLGVGPEVRVAVCMPRSRALAVAALGIWKSGGAFVPLDLADPSKRRAMLLEESESRLVITEPKSAGTLPRGKWQTIFLGEDGTLESRSSTGARRSDLALTSVKPEDLAYVIFTSGSTGRPKGVQITHANLSNLIGWHIRAFGVTAADRATMLASPGFDASIWEMWPHLCTGAAVHVVDDAIRTKPELLRDWMLAAGITISFLPTPLAESMIALRWPPDTSLRILLTGADVLRRYPPKGLPFVLVNNYGPTECSVVATSGIVSPDGQGDKLPTIGRPIENAQVYIVDEQLNPVPRGVSGELLIGGAGVGRGYLNLPELTARRFLANRLSSAGGFLYRTGDLARMLPDGQIMFLGRIDEQVKVRGYRIEPGEISAVLNRHSTIKSSWVIARHNGSADARLIAYVVLKTAAHVSAAELRSWLAEQLPEYMVPSSFVRIAGLPITSHGKVDRDALPAPTQENSLVDNVFEPPQSKVENWLAALLSNLLEVREVSRSDNFFRLGGHSLMGAQLIAEIERRFGVELSLKNLFDHPTVAGIAAEAEALIVAQVNAMSEEEAHRALESVSQSG